MLIALLLAASAILVGGCALGAVIYGVSAHLEADDMDGAPAYDWVRARTWAESPADGWSNLADPLHSRFAHSGAAVPLPRAGAYAGAGDRYAQEWPIHETQARPRAHFLRFLETDRSELQRAAPEAIGRSVASVEPS